MGVPFAFFSFFSSSLSQAYYFIDLELFSARCSLFSTENRSEALAR